jgi:hypothetical protein
MSDSEVAELEYFRNRSYSSPEIVLRLDDALDMVQALSRLKLRLLGWECWLQNSDGSITHSMRHMGSAGDPGSAEIVSRLMKLSAEGHIREPEVGDSELLFCLTVE